MSESGCHSLQELFPGGAWDGERISAGLSESREEGLAACGLSERKDLQPVGWVSNKHTMPRTSF